MAFVFTVDGEAHIGGKRIVTGNYDCSSGAVTGGDITTGLAIVRQFFLQPAGSAVVADVPVYNETLPLINTDGTVTIVTTASQKGSWLAIGN